MAEPWDMSRTRAAWWAVGALLFGALAFVLYSFVGTFVFGLFIYYATRPVYRRLQRYVKPPSVAAAVALLVLALPALLLLIYTIAIGLQELNNLLRAYQFATIDSVLAPYVDVSQIAQNPQDLLNEPSVRTAVEGVLNDALNYVAFIGNMLLHLFVMISIAFYLLRDDRRLVDWFQRRFSDERGVVEAYGRAVDRDFSNIFFGNILNAVLTGLIGAISYNALNMAAPASVSIPYPTVLGLLTGIASLIPVVGMKLVYFPVSAWLFGVAATTDSRLLWFPAVFAVVSFVIVDTIPDFVLRPYVSGRGLHLGMVMFAYIFGPLLFGWYGIFLGPMLLVLIVHFVRIVLPELIAGAEIRPNAVGDRIAADEPPVEEGPPIGDEAGGNDADAADRATENGTPGGEREMRTGDRESADGDGVGDDANQPGPDPTGSED